MTQTLIAIEKADLEALTEQMNRIERMLESVHLEPKPEWITLSEYAEMIGKSIDTVKRYVRDKKVEIRMTGNQVMIRNPQR